MKFSVSKWKGPKRTRTYPYAYVYDTLASPSGKALTIIPLVKDEGADTQNMDYLQWDTIQMMSLLNVYVILAYYNDAERNLRDSQKPNRITRQILDSQFVKSQIDRLIHYHSSALHWNLAQLESGHLSMLMDKAIESYRRISGKTGVRLHPESGLWNFKERITRSREEFISFSRGKSVYAQERETLTTQPKESIGVGIKTPIVIKNFLGGMYFLTIDDLIIQSGKYLLIESKHTRKNLLPSLNDIKDGLLKMMLMVNLDKLALDPDFKNHREYVPIMRLTSQAITGSITSVDSTQELQSFIRLNKFRQRDTNLIHSLFQEATINQFQVRIESVVE